MVPSTTPAVIHEYFPRHNLRCWQSVITHREQSEFSVLSRNEDSSQPNMVSQKPLKYQSRYHSTDVGKEHFMNYRYYRDQRPQSLPFSIRQKCHVYCANQYYSANSNRGGYRISDKMMIPHFTFCISPFRSCVKIKCRNRHFSTFTFNFADNHV